MYTIIKQHLPAFRGDAPKDWVPGSRFRFKSNHFLGQSFSEWCKDEHTSIAGMKVLWFDSLLYEYEVTVQEETTRPIAMYTPKFDGDCPPDYEVGCKTWALTSAVPDKQNRDPHWRRDYTYKYYAKEKQAEPNPSKFWIVWRPGRHGSNPSRRHHTELSAKQEAERLSKANPSIEFVVLESKACFKSTAHVTTETQEYE